MFASLSFEKAWFALSLVVLSFGYGFASHAWGLFPKTYIVSFANQAGQQASEFWGAEAEKFTTPRVYDRAGVRVVDSSAVQPGLTLMVGSWQWDSAEGLEPGAKLIDRTGRTVHEWHPDRGALFGGTALETLKGGLPSTAKFHGSHLLSNGDLLLALNYIGLLRIDACGNVKWKLEEGIHHSVARAEDGSFWVPATSAKRRTKTEQNPNGFPGLNTSVWMDRLLHISEDGTVLDDINVLDVLYANDLKRYVRKAHGRNAFTPDNGDPTHVNDIEPLPSSLAHEYPLFEAGDLVVSLKHPNLVLVLDPASRTVKWSTDSGPSDGHHLIQQHDPDFMGEGWIGVFNNREDLTDRGTMLGGSQILAFQPHTDSVKVLFPTSRSGTIYTRNRGKWQYLKNGNLLLTESNAGRAVEVTAHGQVVWERIHQPYSESEVPFLTEATRYDLTRSEVTSWSCSSVQATPDSTTS